jgi:hypothetical protein
VGSLSRIANAAAGILRQSRSAGIAGVLWLLAVATVISQTAGPSVLTPAAPGRPPPVGEELVYRVYWGVVPVAKAKIAVSRQKLGERDVLAIRYRAKSNRVLAWVYPVDDSAECLLDSQTLLPIRCTINLREGRHKSEEITSFDHSHLTATWRSVTKDKTKTFPIEADSRDLISFLYFLRPRHFEEGQKYHFRPMADEKLYDLWIKTLKHETASLPGFGKVKSLKMEPSAAFNGLFIRKGRMWIWTSNDERNVLTRVEASLPVANIKAILTEVHGGPTDFWSTTTEKLVQSGKIESDDPEVEESLQELGAPAPQVKADGKKAP